MRPGLATQMFLATRMPGKLLSCLNGFLARMSVNIFLTPIFVFKYLQMFGAIFFQVKEFRVGERQVVEVRNNLQD